MRQKELVLFLLLTLSLLAQESETQLWPRPWQPEPPLSFPGPFLSPAVYGQVSPPRPSWPWSPYLLPLSQTEQAEQCLLPLDCCVLLTGWGPVVRWPPVRWVGRCCLLAAEPPSLDLYEGLDSFPSAVLFPALFAFGTLVPVGLKDSALSDAAFPELLCCP